MYMWVISDVLARFHADIEEWQMGGGGCLSVSSKLEGGGGNAVFGTEQWAVSFTAYKELNSVKVRRCA